MQHVELGFHLFFVVVVACLQSLVISGADFSPNLECPAGYTGFLAADLCHSYTNCFEGTPQYEIECSDGLLFDEKLGFCNFPHLVECSLQETAADPSCPNGFTGRRGIDQCLGFVDCMNGFEIFRDMCEGGRMYDSWAEDCVEGYVSDCSGVILRNSVILTPKLPAITTATPASTTQSSGTASSILPLLRGSTTPPLDRTSTTTTSTTTTKRELFYPDWSMRSCVLLDVKHAGVSQWHHYYKTHYQCCVGNFLSSLKEFESCIGFSLDLLEPPGTKTTHFYPNWVLHACVHSDHPPHWAEASLTPKKSICCFEYYKWNFDDCMATDLV